MYFEKNIIFKLNVTIEINTLVILWPIIRYHLYKYWFNFPNLSNMSHKITGNIHVKKLM